MIQITLYDSFHNEIDLDDIILVHYPNEDVKFLGVLKFNEHDKTFFLQYQGEHWQSIFCVKHEKYQRICKAIEKPHLLMHTGRYNHRYKSKFLLNLLNQI
jgi:hypothetical protein